MPPLMEVIKILLVKFHPFIVITFSREFLILVFIALLIASPLAWYVMNKWLDDYVYKTHISWWMFVIAGIVAIVITLFTVSYQAVKADLANPVRSLRSE